MASNAKHVIGVDLGGTNIQVGVVNEKNQIVARSKSKTHAEKGSDSVIERIVKTVQDAIDESKLKPAQIAGLGIGAPGTVNVKKGIVQTAVNLRWNNFPLCKHLTKHLKMPVTLDNDVNVGTWGEFVAGAAKTRQGDLLGIFVGTGIGGGLVLNGQLYAGDFGTAGEIGHVVLHANGTLGRRTLENAASRTNIVRLITDLIRANHPSSIGKATDDDLDNIRSKALAEALSKKDPLTTEVVKQAATYVGIAIANTVTLLSLSNVVVGGGMVEAAGNTFVDWVRESFEANVFPPDLKKCNIMASKLGDDAGVIGAADLARQRLLK